MNQTAQTTLIASASFLAAILILANIAAATYGLDSIRMIQTFSLDEGIAITRMQHNLEQSSLDPDGFYYYGNLYHSIAYYCLVFLERFGWTINTSLAGFVLRLLSITSAALAWLSLWKLGKLCNLPTAIAAAAALAMLTMPDFVYFSRMMHPDVLQTFFVIVSLGAALVRPTFSFALVSAVAAGLAFSTKYIGAVVLPFGFLPLALSTLGREQASRQVLLRLFTQGLAMIGASLAVFVLTNPYAAADRRGFISTFIWQFKYSSNGYGGVVAPANPALWFEPLTAQLGIVGVLYLFGGMLLACVFLLRDVRRAGWRTAFVEDGLRTRIVLVLYTLAASAHLAISIHQREMRFTYHVVPFLIILSTLAALELIVALARRIARPQCGATALAALLLVFGASQIWVDLRAMATATTKPESEDIKFGSFIAQHYPPDTRILADSYTYLPPSMTNATFANLQTEELLNQVAPDLIVLRSAATGTSVWKKKGTSFTDGNFIADQRYADAQKAEAYLRKLASPSSGWSVVREDNSEILLERSRH